MTFWLYVLFSILLKCNFTLNDSDIPKDAGVAIEYNIPQTSKRVDFLISGYGLNGKGNVVIVELKQGYFID